MSCSLFHQRPELCQIMPAMGVLNGRDHSRVFGLFRLSMHTAMTSHGNAPPSEDDDPHVLEPRRVESRWHGERRQAQRSHGGHGQFAVGQGGPTLRVGGFSRLEAGREGPILASWNRHA